MKGKTLKPCPFCGGSAEIEHYRADLGGPAEAWVMCANRSCEISPSTYSANLTDAIAAWNHRAPSPHGQDVEALVRAGTHVVVSTREWAYALQAMGIPEDRWQPDTLRSRPVEPEPVACFFRLIRLHSHEVSADRIAEHRVPPGTRLVGRLYIAPDGELVVTDGWPNDEVADEDPYVHNCDEMGCSTVSHVIARLASPVAPREEKPE